VKFNIGKFFVSFLVLCLLANTVLSDFTFTPKATASKHTSSKINTLKKSDVRSLSIKEVFNEEDANEEDGNEKDDIMSPHAFYCETWLFSFRPETIRKPEILKESWQISKLQKPLFIRYRNLRI